MQLVKIAVPVLAMAAALGVSGCASADRPPAAAETVAAVLAVGGPADYDALLHKYVHGEFIDYAGWHANPADMARFDAFLRWQGDADVKAMTRDEQIAFYVNAYNACCVKMVLDRYPVHAPVDIDGFFDKIKFRIGGEDLTVSNIEYDRLIPLKDMRAHFAIVCADRGCPPLANTAYIGAAIDSELDAAAKRFVADKRNLVVDPAKNEVQISKLFEWYGKDFAGDPVRPAAKPELYLMNWAEGDAKSVLAAGNYSVKIIEWSWTLNEKR